LAEKKAASLSFAQRQTLVERDESELPLSTQADLLTISRSSLYYQPTPVSARELAIKHRIDELYTATPFYGSRKLQVLLKPEFGTLARNTVRRYMQEMGITAIYPAPNLSRRHPDHRIYPYVLRGVTARRPNHIWGIDITYIRHRHGWMYLVAVLDWYARYVVSWALDETLEMPFVLDAVERALDVATPEIFNSDQGSHFTSPQYIQRLEAANVRISMDGKGRALDNIFTERFWRSLKYEDIYLHDYTTPREVRQGITRYITLYNGQRPHQALEYRTPAAVYFAPAALTPADAFGGPHDLPTAKP
jgi:putative transposase